VTTLPDKQVDAEIVQAYEQTVFEGFNPLPSERILARHFYNLGFAAAQANAELVGDALNAIANADGVPTWVRETARDAAKSAP